MVGMDHRFKQISVQLTRVIRLRVVECSFLRNWWLCHHVCGLHIYTYVRDLLLQLNFCLIDTVPCYYTLLVTGPEMSMKDSPSLPQLLQLHSPVMKLSHIHLKLHADQSPLRLHSDTTEDHAEASSFRHCGWQ